MRLYDTNLYLTDEYHKILGLVYKFRFINSRQIQKIFGHKVPRRINPWLKELTEHKYLGRIYHRNKLLENTKPAIYYLDNQGIGWVRSNHFEDEPQKVKRFYQDKTASERFRNHCIAVCDLYVNGMPPKKNEDDGYHFSPLTELWENEELRNIRPDAHITIWVKNDITTYFLDLIESYVPMYAIKYKIDEYIELRSETDRWDVYSYGDDFENVVIRFILPNQSKLNRVGKYIQERMNESYDIENMKFMLTTYKKAVEKGINDKSIWKVIKES